MAAPKRLSLPSADRLATIDESARSASTPPVPRRSSKRTSAAPSYTSSRVRSPRRGWSASQSTLATTRTGPPAYDWVPEPLDGEDDGNAPVEGEKLAELRRDENFRTPARRGGWGRLVVIAAVILLLVIALAVGLGVGLSQKSQGSHHDSSSQGSGSGSTGSNAPPQKFPLGQYSFVTALTSVETACASSATWRCYPFVTFDPATSSTVNTSMTVFNWIINNTDSKYATIGNTESTPAAGVPANLTVSAVGDPFGITFGPKPLTYIASSSNSTSSRYTFTFTMDKKVVPSPAITTNNAASVCFFNQTVMAGNIYLSAPRNYPAASQANSTSVGGYEQWPYAVEIAQTASGGPDVPNCYKTVDGVVGSPINTGIPTEPSDFQCLCDYRNYY